MASGYLGVREERLAADTLAHLRAAAPADHVEATLVRNRKVVAHRVVGALDRVRVKVIAVVREGDGRRQTCGRPGEAGRPRRAAG